MRWLARPMRWASRRGALRRADIDDEIDVAPVDAEVERRGTDYGAQAIVGHRRLHLAALGGVERAVVEGDREGVLVDAPQLVEEHLRLGARVDEDEAGAVRLDEGVDVGECPARHVAGPGHARVGLEDRDVGLRAARYLDQRGAAGFGRRRLADEVGAEVLRVRDGGREADGAQVRRVPAQPREAERQEVAPLGGDEGVQLVDDHHLELGKEAFRVALADKERHLLGGGEQDVGRVLLLAAAAVLRRVAGARLERDVELHLLDGRGEIARDVDREGLEGGDVERVRPLAGLGVAAAVAAGEGDEAGEEPRQRLARAGGGDEEGGAARLGLVDEGELVRAGRPAAHGEPAGEGLRQGADAVEDLGLGHVRQCSAVALRPKPPNRSCDALGKSDDKQVKFGPGRSGVSTLASHLVIQDRPSRWSKKEQAAQCPVGS